MKDPYVYEDSNVLINIPGIKEQKKLDDYESTMANLGIIKLLKEQSMNKDDIKEYIDGGRTALCPKCGIDSIIPDSIDERIDEKTIDDMNKFWF